MVQKSHFWIIPQIIKNRILKRYLYPYVHCCIIHKNQDMKSA